MGVQIKELDYEVLLSVLSSFLQILVLVWTLDYAFVDFQSPYLRSRTIQVFRYALISAVNGYSDFVLHSGRDNNSVTVDNHSFIYTQFLLLPDIFKNFSIFLFSVTTAFTTRRLSVTGYVDRINFFWVSISSVNW